MIKDILASNDRVTPNAREMDVLKQHFPSCFKPDGSFDLERFKRFLSDKIAVTGEGYELKFLGKNYARLLASLDTTTVVVPNEEHNLKPENADSENLYISGDNLDGLKHLLKSYAGKVKCIYIDPPYNTGTDGFVYNDRFSFSIDELSERLSVSEDQARRILDLTKRGSASHSAWLMFMYPRLLLARDLLSDDGVIFMSIDDNEQANLKLLCDDVFGEDNFEGHVHWRRRHNQPNDKTKLIGLVAEHILVYARNSQRLKEAGVGKVALTGDFSNPDNDPRGDWASKPWKAGSDQSGTRYTITTPSGVELNEEWMGDLGTYTSLQNDNRIYFPRNGDGMPRKKYFRTERELEGQCAMNWWVHEVYGNNQLASEELTTLFGFKNAFSNPKPTQLIDAIIGLSNVKDGDIIMDFFSGSATTAHSALRFSLGCRCKFIMVQLPEDLEELLANSSGGEADKWARIIEMLDEHQRPHTIDQIGMERIIRAAQVIKEDYPDTAADLGFKHYTLVEPSPDTLDKLESFDSVEERLFANETLLRAFGEPTILATWLVRDGYGLSTKAKELDFAGYKAHFIGRHLYLIEPGLPNEAIEAIVIKYETDGDFNPENVVLFGYSFAWTELEALQINLKRLRDTEKNLRINFDIRY